MFSCLPGLNPYLTDDKVSFSKTQHSSSGEFRTIDHSQGRIQEDHMYKRVGVRFADFISFVLNIP